MTSGFRVNCSVLLAYHFHRHVKCTPTQSCWPKPQNTLATDVYTTDQFHSIETQRQFCWYLLRVGLWAVLGSDHIGAIIVSPGVPWSLKSWGLDSRLASPAVRISPPKSCTRRALLGGENTKGSAGDWSSGGPSDLGGGRRSRCGLVGTGSVRKYLQQFCNLLCRKLWIKCGVLSLLLVRSYGIETLQRAGHTLSFPLYHFTLVLLLYMQTWLKTA
jgi:hypothetical protein